MKGKTMYLHCKMVYNKVSHLNSFFFFFLKKPSLVVVGCVFFGVETV